MPLGIEAAVRGVHPRAVRGLLHGKSIQHGFQCVDKGKRPRTRRDWQPNIQYKFLYSEALQRKLKVCVSTHALKRIDKAGGLDMYLLTEPVASQGSIVASELRKAVQQAYKASARPLPKKEGNTSILSIVREHLKAAGIESPSPATKKPRGSTTPSQPGSSSIKPPPSAATSPSSPSAPAASESIIAPIPHCDVPRTLRARRRALAVQHILRRKAHLAVGDRGRYAAAREAVLRDVKGLTRHQLLRKVPKPLRRQLQHRLLSVTRPPHTTALTSGKRVDQALREAVRRAQIRARVTVRRRNALVASMRGEARNKALKQMAVDPRWRGVFRHGWLQDLVGRMEEGAVKEQWKALADKFQPNVPGVIIDGTFVPSASRHRIRIRTGPATPPAIATAKPLGTAPQGSPDASADVQRVSNAGALLAMQKRPLESAVVSYLSGESPEEAGLKRNEALRKALLRNHRDFVATQAYPVGRKLRKMRKWLDDDWVKAHIVPQTGPWQFVLGNGMVLPSRTRHGQTSLRRLKAKKRLWKDFKAAGGLRGAAAGALHTAGRQYSPRGTST
eukprot:jgi/Ulvmu1/11469/UM077_0013.1